MLFSIHFIIYYIIIFLRTIGGRGNWEERVRNSEFGQI